MSWELYQVSSESAAMCQVDVTMFLNFVQTHKKEALAVL